MITQLSGRLIQKTPPFVVLDCNGVGYECEVPLSTFYQLPALSENVILLTHFIVREDAHLLYGFATLDERHVFRQLLKVSGIGAKSALAILSGMSLEELMEAVQMQESRFLIKIPGIGKKTAERLLLELKDKPLLAKDSKITIMPQQNKTTTNSDILEALISLGYHEKEALLAIKQVGSDMNLNDGIKAALKALAKL